MATDPLDLLAAAAAAVSSPPKPTIPTADRAAKKFDAKELERHWLDRIRYWMHEYQLETLDLMDPAITDRYPDAGVENDVHLAQVVKDIRAGGFESTVPGFLSTVSVLVQAVDNARHLTENESDLTKLSSLRSSMRSVGVHMTWAITGKPSGPTKRKRKAPTPKKEATETVDQLDVVIAARKTAKNSMAAQIVDLRTKLTIKEEEYQRASADYDHLTDMRREWTQESAQFKKYEAALEEIRAKRAAIRDHVRESYTKRRRAEEAGSADGQTE